MVCWNPDARPIASSSATLSLPERRAGLTPAMSPSPQRMEQLYLAGRAAKVSIGGVFAGYTRSPFQINHAALAEGVWEIAAAGVIGLEAKFIIIDETSK